MAAYVSNVKLWKDSLCGKPPSTLIRLIRILVADLTVPQINSAIYQNL